MYRGDYYLVGQCVPSHEATDVGSPSSSSVCPSDPVTATNTTYSSEWIAVAYRAMRTVLNSLSDRDLDKSKLVFLTHPTGSAREEAFVYDMAFTDFNTIIGFEPNTGGVTTRKITRDQNDAWEKAFDPLHWLSLVTLSIVNLVVLTGYLQSEHDEWIQTWAPRYFGPIWATHRDACERKIGPLLFIDQAIPVLIGERAIYSTGILGALLSSCLHFVAAVVFVSPSVYLATVYGTVDTEHCCCMQAEIARNNCPKPNYFLTVGLSVVAVAFLCLTAVYSVLYYLGDVELRFINRVSGFVSFAIFAGNVIYFSNLVIWLTLGALINPNQYVQVVVAVTGFVVSLKTVYAKANEIRETIRQSLMSLADSDSLLKDEVEQFLADAGFGKANIAILTLALAGAMLALFVFILIGIKLFSDSEQNVFNTVVQSAMFLAAAGGSAVSFAPNKSSARSPLAKDLLSTATREADLVTKEIDTLGPTAKLVSGTATLGKKAACTVQEVRQELERNAGKRAPRVSG